MTQPTIPPSCVVLHARLSARRGVLPAAAEGRTDTARIWTAISGTAGAVSDVLVRNLTVDGARNLRVLTPGYYSGLDPQHLLRVSLDNVFAEGLDPAHLLAADAHISLGPSLGNLVPSGQDVTVSRLPNSRPGTPPACASRFLPFPTLPAAPRLAVKAPPVANTLYVAADGTGDYYSIQRAIDVAPATGALISVAPDGAASSPTVTVTANDFLAENLTFEGAAPGTAHARLTGSSQPVALMVSGRHDVFRNARVLGKTVHAARVRTSADGQRRADPLR